MQVVSGECAKAIYGELQAVGAKSEYVRKNNGCDILFDLDAERQIMVGPKI